MKYKNITILVINMMLTSCLTPNIYNDGTAWKMPRDPNVSDFYYNIDNTIQYEGRDQEFMVKIKSFYWQNENDVNHTIESAFFIVKHFSTGKSYDYEFQYRRYIIIANEKPKSNKIRNLWFGVNEIQRGSTLYLSDSYDERFVFGEPYRTSWYCKDGLYERHRFEMYFERIYGPILNRIINSSEEFKFNFPSENLETNGWDLDESELERIRKNGMFPELENNSIILSKEELENLKKELAILMLQEKLQPDEYLRNNEILK
jgi:hypothetical protein